MENKDLAGKHVHFIGIGGSGLSSIAVLLKERGVIVSGSDQHESIVTRRLTSLGMTVALGHSQENIAGANLVVRSSAVKDENVEVQSAINAGIPVLKREAFLPYMIGAQDTIAIAGTHGKTTTTALIAWLMRKIDLDPSYIVGGFSSDLGGSAHYGRENLFVIEADEYDRMFLGLTPRIAVVTNIEHDHPDCYPTEADVKNAFKEFTDRLVESGALLACEDNPGSLELLRVVQQSKQRCYSYSTLNEKADYFSGRISVNNIGGCSFSLHIKGQEAVEEVRLKIPGKHNVSNTLAALGVIDLLGYPVDKAAQFCQEFNGLGRRFEIRGEPNQILLIDDYAHHPTEIRSTLAAARLRYPLRRIWAVWQPHTYSRTRTLLKDFQTAFIDADRLIVTEIYSAREEPPADGFSGHAVVDVLMGSKTSDLQQIFFTPELSDAGSLLRDFLTPGDVLIVLSAGDADWINTFLLDKLG